MALEIIYRSAKTAETGSPHVIYSIFFPSWHSVSMPQTHTEKLKPPSRIHFSEEAEMNENGEWGVSICGRRLVNCTRLFAPSAEETRKTLIELRQAFEMSRPMMAANLAVSVSTIKSWECGTRKPSMMARRLIWFLKIVACGDSPENLFLWRITHSQGGEH